MNFSEEDRKYLQELTDAGPIKWCEAVLTNPETKEPLKFGYAQRQMLSKQDKFNYVCVDGQTKVIDPTTLRPVPIEVLPKLKESPVFDFTTNKVVWSRAKWFKNPQQKECLKLEFESGRVLRVTLDHEVYTKDLGWIESKDFKVGNSILIPDTLDLFGEEHLSHAEIENLVDLGCLEGNVLTKIFRLDEESLRYYFHYFFSNEGRLFDYKNVLALFNKNRSMAEDHQHLLLRFGIHSRITSDNVVLLVEDIDIKLFLDLVGVPTLITEVKPPRCWDKLVDVKRIGLRTVYDISVEHHDHNFLANDLVVHNCIHRRAGKTWGVAALILYYLCTIEQLNVFYLAQSSDQIKQFFNYLDAFIENCPLIRDHLKKKVGNVNGNRPTRKFINESHITGICLKITDNLRGLTPDIVIMDEAQSVTDEGWAVAKPFMVAADLSGRAERVISWIIGTIRDPSGDFYSDIFIKTPAQSSITLLPITKNPDYSDEDRLAIRAQVSEDTWITEYLLQPTGGDNSIFPQATIDNCFREPYLYGTHHVNRNHFRIMGCDWDRVQTGPSIVIAQYDPVTENLTIIHHETIPQVEKLLKLTRARFLELFVAYNVDYICADQGGGGNDRLELFVEDMENLGIDISQKMFVLPLQTALMVPNKESANSIQARGAKPQELVKKMAKTFLVGELKERLERGLLVGSSAQDDEDFKYTDIRRQLIKYSSVTKPSGKQGFSNKDEHFIDCLLFIEYIIFLFRNEMKEMREGFYTSVFLSEFNNRNIDIVSPISSFEKITHWNNMDADALRNSNWRPNEGF